MFFSVSLELRSTKCKHKVEQQLMHGLIVFGSNWLGFHTANNWQVAPSCPSNGITYNESTSIQFIVYAL